MPKYLLGTFFPKQHTYLLNLTWKVSFCVMFYFAIPESHFRAHLLRIYMSNIIIILLHFWTVCDFPFFAVNVTRSVTLAVQSDKSWLGLVGKWNSYYPNTRPGSIKLLSVHSVNGFEDSLSRTRPAMFLWPSELFNHRFTVTTYLRQLLVYRMPSFNTAFLV